MEKKINKSTSELQLKQPARFTEIYFVVKRFCERKRYDPQLIPVISMLVYNNFYSNNNKSPRNTRCLRRKKIGLILDSFDEYRQRLKEPPYDTNDTDSVTDHFDNIHHECLIELLEQYPDIIHELQPIKGRKMSKSIRFLLHLYSRKVYVLDRICRIMKMNKKSIARLQEEAFKKLLVLYEVRYDMEYPLLMN